MIQPFALPPELRPEETNQAINKNCTHRPFSTINPGVTGHIGSQPGLRVLQFAINVDFVLRFGRFGDRVRGAMRSTTAWNLSNGSERSFIPTSSPGRIRDTSYLARRMSRGTLVVESKANARAGVIEVVRCVVAVHG